MATQPTDQSRSEGGKSTPGSSAERDASKMQVVVVDFGKPQTRKRVKSLRKGRGKLMERVENIVGELVESGAVKASAQPVVIVLRERLTPPLWPF